MKLGIRDTTSDEIAKKRWEMLNNGDVEGADEIIKAGIVGGGEGMGHSDD